MSVRQLVTIFLLFLAPSLQLVASVMPTEMNVIIRTTMAADGSLNKEVHKRFWELAAKELNLDRQSPALKAWGSELSTLTLGMYEFQSEVWKSARKSNIEGAIIQTQRLRILRANMLSEHRKAAQAVMGGKVDIDQYMEQFTDSWKNRVIPNTDALLFAASENAPVRSVTGEITQPITLQIIDETIESLSMGFKRGLKLLNPVWTKSPSGKAIYIIGYSRGDANATERQKQPIFFKLAIDTEVPSGIAFTFDGTQGSIEELKLDVTQEDHVLEVTIKMSGFIRAQAVRGWCIDRTTLAIWSFDMISFGCDGSLQSIMPAPRVGNIVSSGEFEAAIQKVADQIRSQTFMKELEQHRVNQERLNNRKI